MNTSLLKKLIAFLMAMTFVVGMIGFTVSATDENAGETAGSETETTPEDQEQPTEPETPVVIPDKCDLEDLKVTGKNVENKSMLYLAIAVDYETEGRLGIYVYKADAVVGVDDPIYYSYDYKMDRAGKLYFATQAIAYEDVATQYKIVPVLYENRVIKYGEAITYSVADYCNARLALNSDEIPENDITADQALLYKLILSLGKNTGAFLNPPVVEPEEEVTE